MNLCPKCNQDPEQVGRGDGCQDAYCPISPPQIHCVSERRLTEAGYAPNVYDWLEQTWTNGERVCVVALPPKINYATSEVIFDYGAGQKMAERIFARSEGQRGEFVSVTAELALATACEDAAPVRNTCREKCLGLCQASGYCPDELKSLLSTGKL